MKEEIRDAARELDTGRAGKRKKVEHIASGEERNSEFKTKEEEQRGNAREGEEGGVKRLGVKADMHLVVEWDQGRGRVVRSKGDRGCGNANEVQREAQGLREQDAGKGSTALVLGREDLKRSRDDVVKNKEEFKKRRDERKQRRDDLDADTVHEKKGHSGDNPQGKVVQDSREGTRISRDRIKGFGVIEDRKGSFEDHTWSKQAAREDEWKYVDNRRRGREFRAGRHIVNGSRHSLRMEELAIRRNARGSDFHRGRGKFEQFSHKKDGSFKGNVVYKRGLAMHTRSEKGWSTIAYGNVDNYRRKDRDLGKTSRLVEKDGHWGKDQSGTECNPRRRSSGPWFRPLDESRSVPANQSEDVKEYDTRVIAKKQKLEVRDESGDDHNDQMNIFNGASVPASKTGGMGSEGHAGVQRALPIPLDKTDREDRVDEHEVALLSAHKDDEQKNFNVSDHKCGAYQTNDKGENFSKERSKGKDYKHCKAVKNEFTYSRQIQSEIKLNSSDENQYQEQNKGSVVDGFSTETVMDAYIDLQSCGGNEQPQVREEQHKQDLLISNPERSPVRNITEVKLRIGRSKARESKQQASTKYTIPSQETREQIGMLSRNSSGRKRGKAIKSGRERNDSLEMNDNSKKPHTRSHVAKSNLAIGRGAKTLREQKQKVDRGKSRSISPCTHRRQASPHKNEHSKSSSPRRSERERMEWEKIERDRNTLASFDSRYRRFGGGTSGLGGYSPRRRRSEAAIKTPSPPPRSPERRKPRAWDLPPPGMDSSMVAAISAAHNAAVQQVVVQHAAALVSGAPLVPLSVLTPPATTCVVPSTGLTNVPTMLPSLLQQVIPAVTAVTLTQATRPLRRLYVGNVPSTVSDGELLEFMNAAMLSANANHLQGTKPCINCSVNLEKSYAFAEFITPEDATAALAFDGVTLHGTILKIRRPKDFVLPANGGTEISPPILDMVSSSVADSPHKVFVGGISSYLSSDKVKEIVTAFGQLKAYHWEVDTSKKPSQCYAFLEYMDSSVALKACVGLNGMRFGMGFLTVVQATPDASCETSSFSYGIPKHAQTLLEPPTRILELGNLVNNEELLTMSRQEIEEIHEDIRLECVRFGNVKSMHIMQPSEDEVVARELTEELRKSGKVCPDPIKCKEIRLHLPVPSEQAAKGNTAKETRSSHVNNVDQHSSTRTIGECNLRYSNEDVYVQESIESNTAYNHDMGSLEGDDTTIKSLEQVNHEVIQDHGNCLELTTDALHTPKVFLADRNSEIENRSNRDETGILDPLSESLQVGRVYVEFSREESACQAAHSLHGRTFGDRKVIASFFPLKHYQRKFGKGLGPRTYEEKQALALAVQGHLTAHIKD